MDIMIYIPSHKEFIRIEEGVGDNLLKEDWDDGYVDYLYITVFNYSDGVLQEADGSMIMLKDSVRNVYPTNEKAIEASLHEFYEETPEFVMIEEA